MSTNWSDPKSNQAEYMTELGQLLYDKYALATRENDLPDIITLFQYDENKNSQFLNESALETIRNRVEFIVPYYWNHIWFDKTGEYKPWTMTEILEIVDKQFGLSAYMHPQKNVRNNNLFIKTMWDVLNLLTTLNMDLFPIDENSLFKVYKKEYSASDVETTGETGIYSESASSDPATINSVSLPEDWEKNWKKNPWPDLDLVFSDSGYEATNSPISFSIGGEGSLTGNHRSFHVDLYVYRILYEFNAVMAKRYAELKIHFLKNPNFSYKLRLFETTGDTSDIPLAVPKNKPRTLAAEYTYNAGDNARDEYYDVYSSVAGANASSPDLAPYTTSPDNKWPDELYTPQYLDLISDAITWNGGWAGSNKYGFVSVTIDYELEIIT